MAIGKILGGGLGWAFGGPIGALIGFALGSYVDSATSGSGGASIKGGKAKSDFTMSLLVLSAAVMNADGKVLKSELAYVRAFLVREFGEEEGARLLKVLREVLGQDIPLRDVCFQVKSHMMHPQRLQLVHYLFGIAQADGEIHETEVQKIHTISRYLGISDRDFVSIHAMFGFHKQDYAGGGRGTMKYKQSLEIAYKILEVESTATDEEVKKAYRRMAKKYHPDRLGDLSEDLKKSATEKFQKLQDAYEQVQDSRGMK